MTARHLTAVALESAISTQLALFVIFLLFGRQRRAPALYLLAAFSGALAAMIAGDLLIGVEGWSFLADGVLFLDLLTPPLVYLYVRQVQHPAGAMRSADLTHALPAVLGIAVWKLALVASMDGVVIGCWMLYLAAAAAHFVRFRTGYAPSMLGRFIVVLLSVLGAVTLLRVVMAWQGEAGRAFLDGTPYLLVLAATFLATCQILFTALAYPDLLSAPGSHVKYAGSSADFDALEPRLATLLRERKPHRNPDLTLAELAAMLDVPARHVSQLINTRHGMNFPAYINQFRVRDAALMLAEEKEKPLKVIMYESGFKSKSIFHREFQRCLGVSPSTIRREPEA